MSVIENEGGTVVQCACGVKLRLPAQQAQRRVRCPQCRNTLVEPAPAPSAQETSVVPPLPPAPPQQNREPAAKIHAMCACGAKLGFPPTAAGRKARCPKCAAILIVPLRAPEAQPPLPPPPSEEPANSEEDDLYRLADDPSLSAGTALPKPEPEIAPDAPTAARKFRGGKTCPACEQSLPKTAVLCPQCGINLKTGRSILMVDDSDVDQIYMRAEAIISTVSWVVPSGFLPIASEAFGTAKPWVARGIILITCLVSVWFFMFLWTDRHEHDHLMLWSGDFSPAAIERAIQREIRQTGTILSDEDLALARADIQAELGDAQFQPYQLLTHALLHGDIFHILGNMLLFAVFGTRVNAAIGNIAMAVVYPLLAVAAGLIYRASQESTLPHPSLGASGAIMGMAGMYLVLFPIHKVHFAAWWRWGLIGGFSLKLGIWPVRGFWVVLLYIAFDVLYTAFGIEDNVAHWAHLGGFIAGAALGVLLLVTRVVNARGGDIFSAVLGRHAWKIIGKPRPAKAPAD